MARELTFIDEVSGFPYLIVPHWTVQEARRGVTRRGRRFDDHHSRYRRRDPRLLRGAASIAVRRSRVQLTDRDYHERYHEEAGILPLPTTAEEKFAAVVPCLADYIPPFGVDMGERVTRINRLNYRQIRRFHLSGEVRIESPSKLKAFVGDFILDRPVEFSGLDKLVSDFLCAKLKTPYDWKLQAGRACTLLAVAARQPAEQIQKTYRFGYEHALLDPYAPPNAADFIVSQLVETNVYTMRPLIERLGQRLLRAGSGIYASQLAA